MFDAVKDVDKLVSASTGIFSRLRALVKQAAQGRDEGHLPRGKCQPPQRLHLPVGMPESKY